LTTSLSGYLLGHPLPETIENEGKAAALVELVVELDPVQSQGVQKAFHGVHAKEDAECDACQKDKTDDHLSWGRSTIGMPEKPLLIEPSTNLSKNT
jgi:hypothetical protein